MSMEHLTRNLLEDCDTLTRQALTEKSSDLFGSFADMSESDFRLLKTVSGLYTKSKEYALEQAKLMDEINEKLDMLISATKK